MRGLRQRRRVLGLGDPLLRLEGHDHVRQILLAMAHAFTS